MAASVIFGAILVLLSAGCGPATITSGAPYSSGTPDVVDVAVDFFQDDDRVGELYVNTRGAMAISSTFSSRCPSSVIRTTDWIQWSLSSCPT